MDSLKYMRWEDKQKKRHKLCKLYEKGGFDAGAFNQNIWSINISSMMWMFEEKFHRKLKHINFQVWEYFLNFLYIFVQPIMQNKSPFLDQMTQWSMSSKTHGGKCKAIFKSKIKIKFMNTCYTLLFQLNSFHSLYALKTK